MVRRNWVQVTQDFRYDKYKFEKLRTDVDQKVDCMFTTRNKGYAIRGEVVLRFTAGSFHNLQRNIKL